MKCVIVYESMFGNTEHIARQVAHGLRRGGGQVVVDDVRDVARDDLIGCDLLVVGAPTHAFSLSRASTREDAVRQGADPDRATFGVREWLDELDSWFTPSDARPKVAAFDTRVEKVRRLPGSAARRAAKILRGGGFDLLERPVSFYVEDLKGPAAEGESDRARDWATHLLDLVASSPKA